MCNEDIARICYAEYMNILRSLRLPPVASSMTVEDPIKLVPIDPKCSANISLDTRDKSPFEVRLSLDRIRFGNMNPFQNIHEASDKRSPSDHLA